MAIYTVSTSSPTTADIVFTAETKVQFCNLGGEDLVQDTTAQVALELKDGSEYRNYKITIPKDEPVFIVLPAGTYRLALVYNKTRAVTYKISVTPNTSS